MEEQNVLAKGDDYSLTEKDVEMNQKVVASKDYKKEKFIALYQARTILAKHGTMQERDICKRQLERMKKFGAKSV